MDILTQWNHKIRGAVPTFKTVEPAVDEMVRQFVAQYQAVWWDCERAMPAFSAGYSLTQQASNEKRLHGTVSGLLQEMKRIPASAEERAAWQARLRPSMMDFARDVLALTQHQLDFIESSGMLEASQEFARMARRFDPTISADDIYQAGRNVMTANLIQMLLGLPVEVTPSIFAYSMLYPYTDNYLDDPAVSGATKLAFNHRFQLRLRGGTIQPANDDEARISRLVEMIEGQWERVRYPQVYESLLAIHAAQARSLSLVVPGVAPYELDVLGISFEKGGASVLADGYLVAGWLTQEQAAYLFGYGAFTQLMDDLEDIAQDMREGRMTIFSQIANHWPLDGVTNRFMRFGQAVFSDLHAFPGPASETLKEIIASVLDPLTIDIAARSAKYYSKAYLRQLEKAMPFRFRSIRQQRGRLVRHKLDIGRLIEALL